MSHTLNVLIVKADTRTQAKYMASEFLEREITAAGADYFDFFEKLEEYPYITNGIGDGVCLLSEHRAVLEKAPTVEDEIQKAEKTLRNARRKKDRWRIGRTCSLLGDLYCGYFQLDMDYYNITDENYSIPAKDEEEDGTWFCVFADCHS